MDAGVRETTYILARLHFRELALRYLDDMNPKKSIVIADAILSYNGLINTERPMRHEAHDFFHAALGLIVYGNIPPASNPFSGWIVEWNSKFGG